MNNVYQRPLFMQQGGSPRPSLPSPQGMMRQVAAPQSMMRPPAPPVQQAPPMPQAPPMARPAPRPAGPPGGGAPDMAGISSMVSDKAKAAIDQAQGPEEIINAFRGNQRPLQARYQELAQYVGPQDATATPVSVLTMIQPSLMMTAEGAAQSGIGELMAGIASDVPMEQAPGVPSPMGQGVGELMMSRQAPQPAGLAQGGYVKKFNAGGSSLKDYYNEDLSTFQEIMAPSDEDRAASKRNLFFDIAQRGLAMAGGAGGDGNVASQLANVFQTLPGTYAEQQAELRKGETAARNAALQSASGRVNADRASALKKAEIDYEAGLTSKEAYQQFIFDMTENASETGATVTATALEVETDATAALAEVQAEIAAAKLVADAEGVEFEPMVAIDIDTGEIIPDSPVFNGKASDGVSSMNNFQAGRQDITFVKAPDYKDLNPVSTTAPSLKMLSVNGQTITYNIKVPAEEAAYRAALQNEATPLTMDAASPGTVETGAAGSVNLRGISDLAGILAGDPGSNTLDQGQIINLGTLITNELQPRVVSEVNRTTGQLESRTITPTLNPFTRATIQTAIEDGRLPPNFLTPLEGATGSSGAGTVPLSPPGAATPDAANTGNFVGGVELDSDLLTVAENSRQGFATAPFSTVIGSQEAMKSALGTSASILLGFIAGNPPIDGVISFTSGSQEEKDLTASMRALGVEIMTTLMSSRSGRGAKDEREEYRTLIPLPNQFTSTPGKVVSQYKSLMELIARDAEEDANFLRNVTGQARSVAEMQEAQRSLGANNKMFMDLKAVIKGLQSEVPVPSATRTNDINAAFEKFSSSPADLVPSANGGF